MKHVKKYKTFEGFDLEPLKRAKPIKKEKVFALEDNIYYGYIIDKNDNFKWLVNGTLEQVGMFLRGKLILLMKMFNANIDDFKEELRELRTPTNDTTYYAPNDNILGITKDKSSIENTYNNTTY